MSSEKIHLTEMAQIQRAIELMDAGAQMVAAERLRLSSVTSWAHHMDVGNPCAARGAKRPNWDDSRATRSEKRCSG